MVCSFWFLHNIKIKNLKSFRRGGIYLFPERYDFLFALSRVFLEQSVDALYRTIILRYNNIDYTKTLNLLSFYIPFVVGILIVDDSSVNDNSRGKFLNVL